MKKALSIALAAVMTLTLATGCKKTSPTVDEQGRTKLLIGLPGGEGVSAMKVVENFKAAYGEKYNITTDEAAWSDFTKKVKLQIASKQDVVPVFFSDSMQVMTFGAQGAAEDLKGWIDSTLDVSKYSGALLAMTDEVSNPGETKVWGVPHALNCNAILYNKDIFDEKGIPYPTEDWTWEEMLDIAGKLTFDRDGDGTTDVYGIDYYHNISTGWLPFMAAVGTKPFSDDFRNSNLDDPKVLEAMQKYQAPIKAGHVIDAATRAAEGGFPQAFANGRTAMFLCQSGNIASINNLDPDLNYDAVMMPIGWDGERKVVYVPNCWMIYSGAEDNVKAAAKEWLGFYLNEESQMINAAECPSGFPVMQSALDSITNSGRKPEHIDAFYKGLTDYGMTLLENPASATTRSIIDTMTGNVAKGEKPIEEIVQEAHQNLQTELDYYYENLGQ